MWQNRRIPKYHMALSRDSAPLQFTQRIQTLLDTDPPENSKFQS